eukprot:CAMPEP_0201564840 /NCGR_PEP_ID=MMETSP0190_2-20130828/3443_1 /ASSEMBLY_ACC=CAM_ASM_000263 /TAXON_ID=37353 /ORGANISM="Rosalina sp." /LENGTH=931 /DNA_ID=CAMNT_0047981539 /DNA_START=123 /DNA_END=2918 /DNA_ORIENTATION=-
MQQATEAVYFDDSDDEDYVSFDEEELNKGIADLYDEDSASDYNDDVEDEEEVDLDEIEIEEQALQANYEDMSVPKLPQQPLQDLNYDSNPYPTPMNVNMKKEESKPEKKKKWSLFGNKRDKEKEESESMINKSINVNRSSAFSMRSAPAAASRANRPQRSKKKSKHAQLNKRINRLRQSAPKPRKDKKVIHRQKVNTNIISVDLGTLGGVKDVDIATGDAFHCKSCKAVLSKHDKLLKTFDDIKLDDEDDSIWICKFCNHINIISIDDEEIPKQETVDYILAPPSNMDEHKETDKSESQIIFCVDVSGSMCVTQAIDSKHSHFKLRGNRLDQDKDNLSAFIDHNARSLNQQSEIQYVSRLQCVQSSIDQQIENIHKENPNYKIGLVSFNNEVTVIGDGMGTHEIITGDKLNNLEKLKEIGETKCKINNTIEKAKDKLSQALWKLEENGQTALGPALVVSIAMASSAPGSQVILCTDGLANIGVGSLDQPQEANKKKKIDDQIESEDDDDEEEEEEEDPVLKWYQALGDYAMSKGVVVNIISITDDGCKLENLGKIVEITNGNLKRINPLNLAEKFSGIIENQSVATNCQATMLLHPGLKFHDSVKAAVINLEEDDKVKQESKAKSKRAQGQLESIKEADKDKDKDKEKETDKGKDDDKKEAEKDETEEKDATQNEEDEADEANKINEGRTIYKVAKSMQDCGNVFEGSRIFFEYVINKEKKKEFKTLKQLPFQTQIEYQKKDGSRMLRVISQTKEVTFDKQKVRNNLNFNVLAKYGTHVTTELCAKGDYESSRAWTSANTQFMNKNANNKTQLLTLSNYVQDNVVLDHQMHGQIQTESIQENEDMFAGFSYNNNNNNNNNVSYNAYNAMPQMNQSMAAAPPSASSSSIASSGLFGKSKKKKGKKKKMAARKTARNDQFSSAVYNMKKRSHK